MRKYFTLVIIFVMIFLIYVVSVSDSENQNNPFDYARITEVDYKAVVVDEPGSNGKVIVTERLTFEIHAASSSNLFWELWRDLPEEYIDGVKVEYKVNSVKQIFENGTYREYEESPRLYWDDYDYINSFGGLGPGKWYHSEGPYNEDLRQYECVLFYVDGLYRETVVFEIEYEMINASLRYNDCSELYITLYSEDTIKHLKSFKGQILIPNEKMPRPGNYDAYTYGTNSHDFPFTESDTLNPGYHTFAFELDESQLKFRPYNQYIEFVLVSYGEDKHIFTQYASENYYYYDNVRSELIEEQAEYEALPGKYRIIKVVVFILLGAGAALTIVLVFGVDKKIKKKHVFYQPEMQMDYFREIPSELDPNFAAALVFCKHKSSQNIQDGYAATMLSLVRKGYIELDRIRPTGDWDTGNVRIIVKYKPTQPQPAQAQQDKTFCPKCGNGNSIQAANCVYCAAALQPQRAQMQMPQDKTFCPKCGSGNSIQAANCVFCDAALQPQPAQTQMSQPAQQQADLQQEPAPDMTPLTPTEERYFNLILRHSRGSDISLSSFQQRVSYDYEYTDSFVYNIKSAIINIGVSQGYFQKADYKKPKEQVKAWSSTLGVIGILIIAICNLISYQTRLDLAFGSFFILGLGFIFGAVYLSILSKKYILLSQFGEDEYAKWRGLYNFLNSETLMNERTVIELVIWEQYLIYATAFGISEKVIKAIGIRCPNVDMSPVLRNPYYRSRSFVYVGRSFRTATRTASFTARSGGHGGYGGGGRGGGGGGGGH